MELRTRAEQRELDTGRVTLRKTGWELQKAGSELRTDHIDSLKTIEIRKQAGGGSQKTITGRGTIAESSSPDIAGVVRTLPPDLRKHWDMLTETKKREIIEKAYASANRKDAGEATTSLGQGKNLVRRYGNTPQPERRKDTRQCSEDTECGKNAAFDSSCMIAAVAALSYLISSMFGVAMFYTVPYFFILIGLASSNNRQKRIDFINTAAR